MRDSVDEAQVQKLLHREAGEWVRRIGRIEEISRDAHWLPLDVDIDASGCAAAAAGATLLLPRPSRRPPQCGASPAHVSRRGASARAASWA